MEDNKTEGHKSMVITKLFVGTFETEIGAKCLAHLKSTFVDRPVYKPGLTFEETAFREGERSVIMKIMKELGHE